MDKGQTVAILSTDMSKAFDSMHPILLLSKLKAYGFSQNALDLMRSYFTGRESRARLGQVTSNWRSISRGCPQGSSLGPTLWNIYQNDLFYAQRTSQLSAYTDDHQLYHAHHDPQQAVKEINADGKRTSRWYSENFLEGNLSKYQGMVISKDHRDLSMEIDNFYGASEVELAEELKLLGATIDRNLFFTAHISEACRKASMRVGVLMRLRKLIPVEAKIKIYKVAILPYLTYCGLVWHFCRASDKRKLERVNEHGLRAVYCDWSQPYSELLARARMPSLYNRRMQDVAILMYKVKNNLLPMNIINIFSSSRSTYNLRNSDFFLPRFNTVRYGKHSLRYFGPYLWSRLQSMDRNANSLESFKYNIRKKDLTTLTQNSCSACYLCNS